MIRLALEKMLPNQLSSLLHFLPHLQSQLLHVHLPLDDIIPRPYIGSLVLHLLVADDKDVVGLLQLGLADLSGDAFASRVQLDTEALPLQFLRNPSSILVVPVCNGQHDGLHRAEPQGEFSGVVLDKDTKKSLNAAINNTMDHNRAVSFSITPFIGYVKSFWLVHVNLNGCTLPCPADAILDVDINFWTVKCPISCIDFVSFAAGIEGSLKCCF